jgi:hypothetical protein
MFFDFSAYSSELVQLRANFKLAGLYLLGYKPAHDFVAVGL